MCIETLFSSLCKDSGTSCMGGAAGLRHELHGRRRGTFNGVLPFNGVLL